MAEFLGDWVGIHRSRSPASSHMALPGLPYAVNSIVMLEEVLEGSKGSADTFTDLVGTSVGGEDLLVIKDFLWRHTEISRGRGGISSSSACNSAGVGMVAAAVTLAASVGSGGGNGTKKPLHNPPELPTISGWFTACQILVDGLLAAREGTAEDERVDMDMKPEKQM